MEYFQNIKINSFFLILTLILVILCKFNDCFIVKRSASPESNLQNLDSGMDKIIVNYDEYPMVVPKRAAMLLDRIMVALHHALEDDDKEGVQRISELYKDSRRMNQNQQQHQQQQLPTKEIIEHYSAGNENDMNYYETPDILNGENDLNPIEGRHLPDDTMGLQRRGHDEVLGPNKGRVYWRCYFNAVTCF